MQAFIKLTAIAAPLPLANVDTDKIFPARFMKTIEREGLGIHLFDAMRYDNGQERPEFVLNRQPYRQAEILIAYENFGCGSSREHAPWALLDFGIRCIVAPSFADIFYVNCFKNGILPICQPREICETLMEDASREPASTLCVDLERLVIVRSSGEELSFSVDAFRREMLLNGDDEISLTLRHAERIADFERRRTEQAWLFPPIN